MTSLARIVVPALLTLLLGACASSPPARIFSLEAMATDSPPASGLTLVLGLGPIAMPEYVQRPQIVMRMPDNEIKVQEFVRWAEPLEYAVARILAENIDALMPGMTVVAFPYQRAIDVDYRAVGRIERFDTDSTGQATLSIQWAMRKGNHMVMSPRRDRFTARVSEPGDPGAQVAALNDTLDQLSRSMATAIAAVADTPEH